MSARGPKRLLGRITQTSDRGFGFIKLEPDGVQPHFFHATAVEGGLAFEDLHPGDLVSFIAAESPKGPRALRIRLEEEAPE